MLRAPPASVLPREKSVFLVDLPISVPLYYNSLAFHYRAQGQHCCAPPIVIKLHPLRRPWLPSVFRKTAARSRFEFAGLSPRYTPSIAVSRIGSALPQRVNSRQTIAVDYAISSRSYAPNGDNQILRKKKSPRSSGIVKGTDLFVLRYAKKCTDPVTGKGVDYRREGRKWRHL